MTEHEPLTEAVTLRRLVVIGSIVVDLVLDVPALPERGTDTLARPVLFAPGGGFNVASAAARLGLATVYGGPVGSGPMADRVVAALSQEGIDTWQSAQPDLDTGYCVTLVEPDGERTFVTVTGADAVMPAEQHAGFGYRDDDALYVSGYDLAYASRDVVASHLAALPSRAAGGPFLVVDPSPMVTEIREEVWAAVLPRVDVLSANAREADLLVGVLTRRGRPPVVVRRVGADGADLRIGGRPEVRVAGYPATAVDTNGAGDVHVGAMIAGLADGLDWADAVDLANRAAAVAVTRRGGASGPTRADLP
jgi:ribokinase